MSFADRLARRGPITVAAARPTKSQPLALCLPQLLLLEGRPTGLVNLELAPLVVGGIGAVRLLDALNELLSEFAKQAPAPTEAPAPTDAQIDAFSAELFEVHLLVKQHLDSIAAASDQAHAEHEAAHQHDRGFN